MMRAIVFGCGYSGEAIAKVFREQGHRVAGTVRTAEKAEQLRQRGIDAYVFDGSGFDAALLTEMAGATHLVQSIPPVKIKGQQPPNLSSASPGHSFPVGRRSLEEPNEGAQVASNKEGDPLLKLVSGRLSSLFPKLQWIGYLSTVGVYGDHGGGWVTEETPGSPILGRSIERVDTEDAWAAQAAAAGLPAAVLRLSGIYGPGRNAFVNLERGTARRIIKQDQVFNRIRVEDIAAATLFLAARDMDGLYNVTDDEPAPPQDVIVEAARLMGHALPPEQDFDTAEMTQMARSFYGANKRVSNAKLRKAGFDFAFPDYRVSLAQLWESGRWRG